MQPQEIMSLMTGQGATSQDRAMTPRDEELTSRDAIAELVLANGDLALAAERLYGSSSAANRLVALIAGDMSAPAMLSAQMRTLATINMFATLNKVQAELNDKVSLLDPYDLSKTYTAILDKVLAATDNHESTSNININEVVMSILPPEAREALKQLVADQPTVIDHTEDREQ